MHSVAELGVDNLVLFGTEEDCLLIEVDIFKAVVEEAEQPPDNYPQQF